MSRASPTRILNTLGVLALLVSAIVLIARDPRRSSPPASLDALATPDLPRPSEPVEPAIEAPLLYLHFPPTYTRHDLTLPISIPLRLPSHIDPAELDFGPHQYSSTDSGSAVIVSQHSRFGLNPIHLSGVDRFGRPIVNTRALLVGDLEPESDYLVGGIQVQLSREAFSDDDDLLDDFSSIATYYLQRLLPQIPPIRAGPLTLRHFRAGISRVELTPSAGRIDGRIEFRLVHLDLDADLLVGVTLSHVPVNSIQVDFSVSVSVDPSGRPVVVLERFEPRLNLVPEGSGVRSWFVEQAAWLVEIIAELASARLLPEIINELLAESLDRWITRIDFSTVPPLARRSFQAHYRFSRIDIDRHGLRADLDFRVDCEQPLATQMARLVTEPHRQRGAMRHLPRSSAVVRLLLHSDALNAALHTLWQCGAFDSLVRLDQVYTSFPLAIPHSVRTNFLLPPIVQSSNRGEMLIGVGDALVDLRYDDGTYLLRGNALLPITLESEAQGRSLAVTFNPDLEQTELYLDCLQIGDQPCRGNPVFTLVAWAALPFLPPIGARIPLPDIRISRERDELLSFSLDRIGWHPEPGIIEVEAAWIVRTDAP